MTISPQRKLACIVLAAGKGARMKSDLPKPLHKIAGRPMVGHVLESASNLNPDKIVVVIGPDMPEMIEAVKPYATAIQAQQNGTGGAVLAAREHLSGFDGDILVVYGDSPLVTSETLGRIVEARRQIPSAGLVYSGVRLEEPGRYGRMVLDEDGALKKIVEFKDATPEEKKISLCNGGFLCADGLSLFSWLGQVTNDNAAHEYYLTDLPQIARRDNRTAHVVEIPAEEMLGANTRAELAHLESLMQNRLREAHMREGATLTDPATVYFSFDTRVGRDVTIGPGVIFGPGVTVADRAQILAYSFIEGAHIAEDASVGPFARIRPGTQIGAQARVGNFVEIKNSTLGKGAKAGHLAYLGDADIGEKANIGAGVITCNYDGFEKHKTEIGKAAFIGSNAALVAPVSVGDGAYVGAGSVITKDVPADALGVTRAPQTTLEKWAAAFRRKKSKSKE